MGGFEGLGLDVDASAKMKILHPVSGVEITDENGNEAFIELLSLDSEVAYKRRQLSRKRIFEQVQKGKKIKITPEQAEEDEIDSLVALTKSWHLVNPNTGKVLDIPFSAENAYILYSDRKFSWIKEQVQEFVAERENFFEKSE